MKYTIKSILILSISLQLACTKTDTTDYSAQAQCSGTTPTYTNDIQTILNASCSSTGCHNASSAKAGIDLSDYSKASSQFLNNKNNLVAIHHGSGVEAMPKNASQLDATTVNKLDCWVKNSCPQ